MVSKVSHYRIVKKLGAGGMGEVYLAEDSRLNRQVAIKLLPAKSTGDEQARKRLLREAQAAARLDHPNICAIHEVGEDSDTAFIVMQYIEGESLAERMHTLKLDESLDLAIQVADALSEAHTRGIVHRDIKPQNVIVSPRGQAKVLDFGLAKRVAQSDQEIEGETLSAITQAGAVVGTAAYMSPEQARCGRVDERSDLFSLGAMLYEMATGRRPFTGSSLVEVCAQVLHVDPPSPCEINPRVPPQLERVITKALAKNPSARYQSAEEMMRDLKAARGILDTEEPLRTHRAPGAGTSPVSALKTLSTRLKKPGVLRNLMASTAVLSLAVGAVFFIRPVNSFEPLPAAKRLYDDGVGALRDGALNKAASLLELATQKDPSFALAQARLAEARAEMDYSKKAKEATIRALALSRDIRLSAEDALRLQAITAAVEYDYPSAIKRYEEIAMQSTGIERAYAYFDKGRVQEKSEDAEGAKESYLASISLDPDNAAAFLRLGALYGREENYQEAEAKFASAYQIYQQTKNLEGATEVTYQRGIMLGQKRSFTEARSKFQEAFDMASAGKDEYHGIRALLQISIVFANQGDLTEAEQYAERGVSLASESGEENLATKGLIDLGSVLFVKGKIDRAEASFQRALHIARENQGERNEARALLSLGSLRIQRHNADEGLSYLGQAIPFYEKGGYAAELGKAQILRGQAFLLKGEYQAAIDSFAQRLARSRQTDSRAEIAYAQEGIATALVSMERYPEALKHHRERLNAYASEESKQNVVYTSLDIADILGRLGRYTEARGMLNQTRPRVEGEYEHLSFKLLLIEAQIALSERHFDEARSKSLKALGLKTEQDHYTPAEAKMILGQALSLSGNRSAGKRACEEALKIARESGEVSIVPSAMLALAETLLYMGKGEEALSLAQRAEAIFSLNSQQDSLWKALLIVGRCHLLMGDKSTAFEAISRARSTLADIKKKWGDEHFNSYTRRPDILNYQNQLEEAWAKSQK